MNVEQVRQEFEEAISLSRWKDSTPLGTMEINGRFSHYMDADTDTMWLGFALREAYKERLQQNRAMLVTLLNKV